MKFLAIVILSVLAAVLYGVVHDQITIRICPEYFTVAHARLIQTRSLTLLALFWGVFATWWVGLPLGVLLGIAARAGRWPRFDPPGVGRHIAVLLLVLGLMAVVAGLVAYTAKLGSDFRCFAAGIAEKIDQSMHDRFMAAWAMHVTSYFAGAAGGVVLAIIILLKRRRLPKSMSES